MGKRPEHLDTAETASVLASLELFRSLSAVMLRAIEKESRLDDFPAGHLFFRTGEEGRGLYVVETGRVETYRNFGERRLIVAELGAGGVFGEMGSVGRRVYHCNAETTEPSRIRTIAAAQVEKLLEGSPEVTRKLLDIVGDRFVRTLLELETSSFRQLIPRLARLLLERAEGEWVSKLTHKEMAERLRVYRETVTSAVGELRKAGIVEVERRRIRIVDRGRLERAAREGASAGS